ncbi:hypothetical protein KDW_30720 [Dictyobacter vulcani]|uniref:Uncharacterized protein n=1 Tax=Dictyobacter vulcani TaxID=2607529 RepID=A0A5J4KR39_9CHLR|nr:hypothetical protein [Dictyobacter vulcani]GER88910.1 hypothetical protein KDW_30720 [Dictyobacter vulcani]
MLHTYRLWPNGDCEELLFCCFSPPLYMHSPPIKAPHVVVLRGTRLTIAALSFHTAYASETLPSWGLFWPRAWPSIRTPLQRMIHIQGEITMICVALTSRSPANDLSNRSCRLRLAS